MCLLCVIKHGVVVVLIKTVWRLYYLLFAFLNSPTLHGVRLRVVESLCGDISRFRSPSWVKIVCQRAAIVSLTHEHARWSRSCCCSRHSTPPFTRFIANVSLQQKFDTKKNQAANWKKWMQIWKAGVRNLIVTGLDKQPSTLLVAKFITCIGPDA